MANAIIKIQEVSALHEAADLEHLRHLIALAVAKDIEYCARWDEPATGWTNEDTAFMVSGVQYSRCYWFNGPGGNICEYTIEVPSETARKVRKIARNENGLALVRKFDTTNRPD